MIAGKGMKVLQIIDPAFGTFKGTHGNDTLQFVLSTEQADIRITVLLSGRSVCFAINKEMVDQLSLVEEGEKEGAKGVCALMSKGIPIYVVQEDLEERSLDNLALASDIKIISRNNVSNLYEDVDEIWYG